MIQKTVVPTWIRGEYIPNIFTKGTKANNID